MNKKFKRALYIIGFVLGITVLVLYIVFPKQTEYYFNCVKDFINRPLPIVGVSLAIIGHFIYKIILMTKFGDKKLAELRNQDEELREDLLKTKEKLENSDKIRDEMKKRLDGVDIRLANACALSKNVKINALLKNEENNDGKDTISTDD